MYGSLVESLLVKTCHFEDCCLLLELWSETVTCSFYICSERGRRECVAATLFWGHLVLASIGIKYQDVVLHTHVVIGCVGKKPAASFSVHFD